jgi:hypothetical protein
MAYPGQIPPCAKPARAGGRDEGAERTRLKAAFHVPPGAAMGEIARQTDDLAGDESRCRGERFFLGGGC